MTPPVGRNNFSNSVIRRLYWERSVKKRLFMGSGVSRKRFYGKQSVQKEILWEAACPERWEAECQERDYLWAAECK